MHCAVQNTSGYIELTLTTGDHEFYGNDNDGWYATKDDWQAVNEYRPEFGKKPFKLTPTKNPLFYRVSKRIKAMDILLPLVGDIGREDYIESAIQQHSIETQYSYIAV